MRSDLAFLSYIDYGYSFFSRHSVEHLDVRRTLPKASKNTIGQLVNWFIGKVYRLCSDAFNMYRFNRNCSV